MGESIEPIEALSPHWAGTMPLVTLEPKPGDGGSSTTGFG